jgi:hypothetical protein
MFRFPSMPAEQIDAELRRQNIDLAQTAEIDSGR